MASRRTVLVAVLIYVTLDLSLAAMPGAFVFDPADSFEGTSPSRGRAVTDVVVPPPVLLDPLEGVEPRVERRPEPDARRHLGHRRAGLPSLLPRATLDAAPGSEDPH